jgi:adenylate cyclase, class 2
MFATATSYRLDDMGNANQQTETEVKIAVASFRGFRRQLRDAGFRIRRRRVFERNTIFETDPPSLRPSGQILRLREAGNVFTVTYKGKATVGRVKSREEIEFRVDDLESAHLVLLRLGYGPRFIYEKYRTEYALPGEDGVVTVDETPIGLFAELEGPEKWIEKVSKLLEVADTSYITDSYGALYVRHCQKEGMTPANMVFGKS